ncbi:MAG: hypothetical protein ACKV0T_23525 [Planctomycetales bacterium]
MQIVYSCPACQAMVRAEVVAETAALQCPRCSWRRPVPGEERGEAPPEGCLVCGCNDLWRQKDFPVKLGLALVATGAILSTLAVAWYWPGTALGILLGFALADWLLFVLMPDVLVCYRCAARHRHARLREDHPRFNLETAERYRQEEARLEQHREAVPPQA